MKLRDTTSQRAQPPGLPLVALVAALAMLAAACSSDSTVSTGEEVDGGAAVEEVGGDADAEAGDDGSGDGGGSDDGGADASEAGPLGPLDVADGEPLVFAMISLESGPISFAEMRIASEAAADYVNNHLGGINGRPMVIETCFTDGTPAVSAGCAQQLLDQDPVAFLGGFDPGSPGSIEVLRSANKAWLGGVGLTPVESNYENGVIFANLVSAGNAAVARYMVETVGVSDVAIFFPDNPAGQGSLEVTRGAFAANGVEAATVPLPIAAADLSGQAAAAVAANHEAVFILSPNACVGVMRALDQLGYQGELVGVDACASPQALEAAGSAAEGIYLGAPVDFFGADAQIMFAAFDAYASEPVLPTNPAGVGFASVMNIHAGLDGETEFTTDSILAAFRNGTDNPNFMAPPYTCDGAQDPTGTSMCSASATILRVVDGEVVVLEEWVPAFGE